MNIDKVTFLELEHIQPLIDKYKGIITETYYGTKEILKDTISGMLDNDYIEEEYGFTKEEFLEDLKQYLGNNILEAFENKELDFILLV